jgi:hypothetical protein
MINIKESCMNKMLSQVGTGIKTYYEYSITQIKKIIFPIVFKQTQVIFSRY